MLTAADIRKAGARAVMFADLARGGWIQKHVCAADERITITTSAETRSAKAVRRFFVRDVEGPEDGGFATLEDAVDALYGTTNGCTLEQQAAAIERAAANWRGHLNRIQELVAQKKRPAIDLEMLQMWVPQLEAAAISFRRFVVAAAEMPLEPPTKEQLAESQEPALL